MEKPQNVTETAVCAGDIIMMLVISCFVCKGWSSMPKHVEHEVHSTCCTWSRSGLGILSSTRCSRLLKVKVVIVNPSQKCCITSSSAEKDILFQRNQTFGLNLNPDKSSVWCLQVIGPGEVNPLHRGIKCVQDKGGQKIVFLLRTTNTSIFPSILGGPFSSQGWNQTKLQVGMGGLGIRAAFDHSEAAYACSFSISSKWGMNWLGRLWYLTVPAIFDSLLCFSYLFAQCQ